MICVCFLMAKTPRHIKNGFILNLPLAIFMSICSFISHFFPSLCLLTEQITFSSSVALYSGDDDGEYEAGFT